MTAFETIAKHYEDPCLSARVYKAQGGKVVGYLCDNVPVEFINAAGLFPLRLKGDPQFEMKVPEEYAFDPHREEFINSIIYAFLDGKYDFMDYLIIPHARDSVVDINPILTNAKMVSPGLKLPELFFMDNLHTTTCAAEAYNRDRWIELKNKLEEWSGKKITEKALSEAIKMENENKELLKQVAALRSAEPARISGTEALQIIGTAMFMPKAEHNQLLKAYLKESDKLQAREGVRLFVEGSPQDNLKFYELVESCGAVIVGEDNCWGNRYIDVSINTNMDPAEAIMYRYHCKSPCPRMYPIDRRIDYFMSKVIETKAQGAVFNAIKFDEVIAWEIPSMREKLNAANLPSVHFKSQPYRISDPTQIKNSICELIANIKSKGERASHVGH
jgi:benzoyl-CoA reductase/2-hydroxyglutaryl-CoA dehydratase subunit BcrC/BadD/HgdB